ncbi:MAG: PilZ domain-containing protein, partial [Myxococcales bacterium]|nr:PilZ domain-containing protein [Myxococcales bacterium]
FRTGAPMSTSSYEDRRRHPRVECAMRIRVREDDTVYDLTTRDVSLGGVFLFSKASVALNAAMTLQLEAGERTLDAGGTVVHRLPGVGFGVRFDWMAEDGERRLAEFLDAVGAEAA